MYQPSNDTCDNFMCLLYEYHVTMAVRVVRLTDAGLTGGHVGTNLCLGNR